MLVRVGSNFEGTLVESHIVFAEIECWKIDQGPVGVAKASKTVHGCSSRRSEELTVDKGEDVILRDRIA